MVVFGGGNEGIVDELHVYNTGKMNFVFITLSIVYLQQAWWFTELIYN